VYIISIAAELAGVHPQTLRIYERKGLLSPQRTSGNTRRYSERDIARLQTIQELTQRRGVNLAGVKLIMEMEAEIERLRLRTADLEAELQRARRPKARPMGPSTATFQIVPVRSVSVLPWQE
jgi:MerR family transcriptional regulator/heat shock protein HspR